MSKTRNNHYVPQWYQERFFEPGCNKLAYLDTTPPQRVLQGGRVVAERAVFDAPTSRAFRQRDLYSTFFGTSVDDEIERRLFPPGGIQDNNVNRLLLMSSSERHLPNVPMAFLIEGRPSQETNQSDEMT